MLISPAMGHTFVHVETAGGGTALLIILAGVTTFILVYRGWKKRQKRNLQPEDGAE